MIAHKSTSYSTSETSLFLNPLEHGGKQYIRLWHKPNPLLSKRLKEATWMRYSKTYKCFVMHHTPQAIELTYGHFQGLAQVNTRYLYRPKRLRPDQHVPLLAGKQQGEPLQKMPGLPVVRLQPMLPEDGTTVVGITYKYSQHLHGRLRQSSVARWQKEIKCFALPVGGQHIQALAGELQGAGWLWLSQELQVKDVTLMRTLWEQTYKRRMIISPVRCLTWRSCFCSTTAATPCALTTRCCCAF